MSASFDVVIVGGGVMGSSVAYHLLKYEPKIRVAVVEKDPTYSRASTPLCLGGVRIQFSLKENIQISQYAMECFSRFEEEMAIDGERPFIGYRQAGYLYFIDSAGEIAAKKTLALQKEMGCEVEWWTPEEVEKHYPFISAKGFAGATFGFKDGYLDPYAVLMAYRAKAISMGAKYFNDEVVELKRSGDKIQGVKLASEKSLEAGAVVNAAGSWAGEIARKAGIELPIIPIRRQVYVCKPAMKIERPWPLVILPDHLYFRSETGGLIIAGKTMEDDPEIFDFTWDRDRFTEIIWPELAKVVPAFETLKIIRGWAGLYEVNQLDWNALLGPWPEVQGLCLINGFSGHGFQQAPAAGRYVAELILKRPPTLDLGCFSPQRILEHKPLTEEGIV